MSMPRTPEELLRWWQRIFGLHHWHITLMEEEPPAPGSNAAYSDMSFAERRATLWAGAETYIVHELCHVLLGGLENTFHRTAPRKALRALYRRREERVVKALEKVILLALREGAKRAERS